MIVCVMVFFFKQRTAYELRISDWSSDVCSSDLSFCCSSRMSSRTRRRSLASRFDSGSSNSNTAGSSPSARATATRCCWPPDRKSVVEGKSVSVRVVLGGRRIINKQKTKEDQEPVTYLSREIQTT